MRLGSKLALIGLTALLAGCNSDHYPDSTKVPAKYKPTVNPQPKYFMTVKGFIDPRLQHRIHLTIVAEYDTYNPKCDLWISHFNGVQSPWQIFNDYPIHPDNKGNYHIKIPLDYYLPGKCDWNAATIMYKDYKASDEDASTVIIFDENARLNLSITHGKANITCSKKSCDDVVYYGFGGRNPPGFSFKQDYTYIRNYFLKEKIK